jgi:hypothetical protein
LASASSACHAALYEFSSITSAAMIAVAVSSILLSSSAHDLTHPDNPGSVWRAPGHGRRHARSGYGQPLTGHARS